MKIKPMRKITVLVAICLMSVTTIAFAQTHTQSISFDDGVGPGNAGTYNSTDTFSFDIFLTYAGYNSTGLSLWLETTADAASHIFLTGFTFGDTFNDPNNNPPATFPMSFTVLEPTGLYTIPNPSDLGGTTEPLAVVGPGTYFLGRLSIGLSGLAPGIYTLQTDATGPHTSEVTSFDGTNLDDNNLPVCTYTITVVPEPSTFALLIVAAASAGACAYRRTITRNS